jgi:hypothetical protein
MDSDDSLISDASDISDVSSVASDVSDATSIVSEGSTHFGDDDFSDVTSESSFASELSEGKRASQGGPWTDEEVAVLTELIQEFPERDASGAKVKLNARFSEMKAALVARLPGNARGKTELRDQVKLMGKTTVAAGGTKGGPWTDEEVAVLTELIQEFPERDASGGRVDANGRYTNMRAALAKRIPGNNRGKTELRDQVKLMGKAKVAQGGGRAGGAWTDEEVEVLKALIVEYPERDVNGGRVDANGRYSNMKAALADRLPGNARGKTELRDQVKLLAATAKALGGDKPKDRPWLDDEIEVLKELMVEFPEKDPATGQRADANARYGNMKRELGERLPESADRGKTDIRNQVKVLKGAAAYADGGGKGVGGGGGGGGKASSDKKAPTDNGTWAEEENEALKALVVDFPEKVRCAVRGRGGREGGREEGIEGEREEGVGRGEEVGPVMVGEKKTGDTIFSWMEQARVRAVMWAVVRAMPGRRG